RQDANLLRDSATAMLAAMARVGVRRCLVVSQGLLFPSWNPVITLLRAILARHVADSTAMERVRLSPPTEARALGARNCRVSRLSRRDANDSLDMPRYAIEGAEMGRRVVRPE